MTNRLDQKPATMGIEVGVYEAKTGLSDLINRVQQGERITITVRGVPMVDLVPAAAGKKTKALAAMAAIKALKKPVLSDAGLKADKEAGRK